MSIDRFTFFRAYLGTRYAQARLTSRARISRRQDRMWRAFATVVARTPALSHLAGEKLANFPVVSPGAVRGQFARWNTLGLERERAQQAAENAEHGGSGEVAPGVSAGFSTGTSGMRGLFLASMSERSLYLGQAIAKLLPWDGLLRHRRIALCLRADNALYRDVTDAGPFKFRFFGLDLAPADLHRELQAFDPHILIGPSHILADLARAACTPASLENVFYGAEPMNEEERAWITERIGVRPDPIYQATEGFLGAACKHGTLHLNEDTLIIEPQPVSGTSRFRPIVTDLRRASQPIVRVLLDDLLEPAGDACPCGSALLAVRGVEGRVGDLWTWGKIILPPRDIETALARAVGPDVEWRSIATPEAITLEIADQHREVAKRALTLMLAQHQLPISIRSKPLMRDRSAKRRRVAWQDA